MKGWDFIFKFKPSDYTLKTKKEYVYEYLGLKFKFSNKLLKL